ncbi:Acyl-CoA dehydrogenase [Sinobacterium norvegicum]|uniref:Acyl-CoA dehydrogenase n=1 Tax=Sinobacterium norvegicum TaxID=1641715 RepID=A0ABM9AJ25_9GAMM|nr:acyl-CoA dehydrogenase family protein [Sinobacterium norvegicum]CAH0993075.1 Acyl-CoA dehydrogenase [Sinobacterium norvegicum]
MQRLGFNEEHTMFRDAFRSFVEKEVVPHQEQWREDGIVSREVWRKAGENGFLLYWADEQYGGLGLRDFRLSQIMMEEMARVGETGFYLHLHGSLVAPYIDKFGNDEQKSRLLPGCISGEKILAIAMTEPGAGSDLRGMKTTAVDCGDHYKLNGSKTFISNGILADYVIVAAKIQVEGKEKIGLLVVERDMPGFERGRNLNKMGLKSQDTAELFFNDVTIPKANLLGDPGRGLNYMMECLAEERLIVSCINHASAQSAFDWTRDYVNERQAFGQAVAEFQNTRFKMAEMATELDICQVYIDRCVEALNDDQLSAEDAAKIKLFSSEMQGRVVDECLQLFGGYGFMDEYPISQAYCDARITRIFGGTSEIMKEIIARSLGLA